MSFKILNYSGERVDKVLVGVPFQLHVIAKGDCDFDRLEFSPGFEGCNLNSLGVMKSINRINGVVSRVDVHKYLARIDQPGAYKLGQIKAFRGINLISSQDLSIDVVEQIDLPNDVTKNPVLEVKTNSNSVYLGEQFVLNVRLYFKSNQISAPKFTIPAGLDDIFDFEFINKPIHGSEQRNGLLVDYWQWEILGSAKRSGLLVIPAISVSFEKIERNNHFFMFANYDQITLFSNIIKLDVHSLPPTTQAVQGIGHFTDFVVTIDQKSLEANQAAQLRLELVGVGNWSKIAITDLIDLPGNLRAYTGQLVQQDHSKFFEFVLQGVQVGSCEIPAQPFYYFDTKLKSYQTIYTKPVALDVLSINQLSSNQLLSQIDLKKADLALNIDQDIQPIFESGEVRRRQNYYLPIHTWLILSLILPLIFLLKVVLNFWRRNKLNKLNLFLLGSLFVANLTGNLEEKFLQANQFYRAGEFAKALELYQDIGSRDGHGAVVLYNLGNCYFQQAKFVKAIEVWLQAGRNGNWRVANNCYTNILVAQARLGIDEKSSCVPIFWINALILYDNFFILQLLSLLFLCILFTCLIRWPNYAKLVWTLIVLVESLIISLAILCAKENNLSYAVVQNSTTLVAGPAYQYHDLIDVKPGEIVKIVGQSADWCQIQDWNELQGGWMLKQDLYII